MRRYNCLTALQKVHQSAIWPLHTARKLARLAGGVSHRVLQQVVARLPPSHFNRANRIRKRTKLRCHRICSVTWVASLASLLHENGCSLGRVQDELRGRTGPADAVDELATCGELAVGHLGRAPGRLLVPREEASLVEGRHARLSLHVGNKVLVLRVGGSVLVGGLVRLLAEQGVCARQTQGLRVAFVLRGAAHRRRHQVTRVLQLLCVKLRFRLHWSP